MAMSAAAASASTSGPDPAVMEAVGRGNCVVFFDVVLGGTATEGGGGGGGKGGQHLGRIKMELFCSEVPRTCENFRRFCTGEHSSAAGGPPVGYRGSTFHRIIRDFMIQGGDFVNGDGTGKTSIYGGSFADEDLNRKHDAPGLLSMANSGPDTNGCQFFLTCKKAEWLDGKHCVFGRVLDAESMLTVRKCEAVPVGAVGNRPRMPVRVVQCGEL